MLSCKTIYFSDGSLVNREKGKITAVKQMSGPTTGQRSVLGVHWHENMLADSLSSSKSFPLLPFLVPVRFKVKTQNLMDWENLHSHRGFNAKESYAY